MSTAETVGFSGLGQMGFGMARHLSLSLDNGREHAMVIKLELLADVREFIEDLYRRLGALIENTRVVEGVIAANACHEVSGVCWQCGELIRHSCSHTTINCSEGNFPTSRHTFS
jgi:hypothetical protein